MTTARVYGWENWESLDLMLSERRHRLQELNVYEPNGREYAETKAEVQALRAEITRRQEATR